MKGLLLCLLVIVAVVAVRSQGPPTRTRKGSRPVRPGDNVDRGLPSGADVPDGRRRGPPPGARPAPPAGRPAPPAGRPIPPSGRPVPPAGRPLPPAGRPLPPAGRPITRTRKGRRPAVQPPLGGRPGIFQHPAPIQRPRPQPYNPLSQFFPQVSCDAFCDRQGFKQVCSIYGNTYDNDCYRECSNEPRACENPCPCPADGADPRPGQVFSYSPFVPFQDSCAYCKGPYGEDYNPVCVEDDVTLFNECEAHCQGKTILCSSSCPC